MVYRLNIYWMGKASLFRGSIAPGFLDYGKKEGGYLESYFPTGDVDKDMALIQTEYAGIKGKYPDQSRW
jgi:hypothetical protein